MRDSEIRILCLLHEALINTCKTLFSSYKIIILSHNFECLATYRWKLCRSVVLLQLIGADNAVLGCSVQRCDSHMTWDAPRWSWYLDSGSWIADAPTRPCVHRGWGSVATPKVLLSTFLSTESRPFTQFLRLCFQY